MCIGLSPVLFIVLYEAVFYVIPYLKHEYGFVSRNYLVYMYLNQMLIVLIMLIVLAGKRHILHVSTARYASWHSIPVSHYYFLLMAMLALLFVLVHAVFDSFDLTLIFSDYAKFYALSKRGTSWVFSLMSVILTVMLYDVYRSGTNPKKTLVFFISLLILLITGGRGNILFFISFFIFILVVVHKIHFRTLTYFGIGLVLFAAFIGNSILRQNVSISDYFSSAPSFLDFNQIYVLNDVMAMLNNGEPLWLGLFEDLRYLFQPRSLFPEKPMSDFATRTLYPDAAYYGSTRTFGMHANLFFNIGYASLFFYPVFLAGWIALFFRAAFSVRRNMAYFVVLYFSVLPVQIIRGGVLDVRLIRIIIPIFLAILLYRVLIYFTKRKIRWTC